MDRTVLLDNEVGRAGDIAGAPPRRLLSVAQPVLLWSTAVAMLATAWAPETTRASPDPVRLAADAQQTMALRIVNSAAAAEDGNSEATPRDESDTKRPMRIVQEARDQSGPPSDQEPNLGGSLSCELSTARLDIGLLQRLEHERERAETLEQGLAAARRDLEVQTALANKAVEDAARVKQAVQGGAGVQDALQQALERAGRLEQDLVAARRDVETQTALAAQAGEEVSRLKRAGEIGTAETRQPPAKAGVPAGGFSLTRSAIQAYEAQARAAGGELAELGQATASDTGSLRYPEQFARLEQDLAVARGELETQTTIATKASEEASRLRQSGERDAADLQREREQSARLERDLAAARRDLETQAALAAKAAEETSRLKAAEASGTPDLKKEDERSAQLEQDLAAARRDLEAQTALVAKAGEEVSRQKLSVEAVVVDLRQSRAKADALAQELSQARSSIYAYEAQALKAGEEVTELRRAAEHDAASAQKAAPVELGQLARLEQDLAVARSEVEVQAALAAKASDETARLKRERENGAAESQNLLQAARQRADRLEQDLVAARRDAESKTALVSKAGDETTRLQVVVKSAAADLQKERERSARLEQDLAAARRDVESRTALVTQAGEQTSRLQAAGKSAAADLQKERERSARLEQDLTTARRDVESKTALAAKAAEDLSRLTSAGKSGAADLQKERERSARLEQDLAAVRRENEVQTARAAKANEDVLLQKTATEADAAELKQLRGESAGVRAQNFFLSRSAIHAYEAQGRKGLGTASDVVTTGSRGPDKSGYIGVAANPIAEQAPPAPARAVVQPASEQVAEAAGLVARASSLLRQGDVGAARLVLERAVEMGSAQASFALAETYDPLVLAKWGTYGTRSDATKAKALYARADAAGIKEAKARLDALHR
ncbi:chromosome segregation ATPase [Bradyrhizobium sp. USDA 4341]